MSYSSNLILENVINFEILFEDAYDPILIIQDDYFVDCNKAALKMLDMTNKKDLFHIHPSQISPEYQPCGMASKEKANQIIHKCYKDGHSRFEWLHQTLQGKKFWTEVSLKTIYIKEEKLLYVTFREISKKKEKQKELETYNQELIKNNKNLKKIQTQLDKTNKKSTDLLKTLTLLDRYKKALDETSIVTKTDLEGNLTYVNDKFCTTSGYTREELLGKKHNIVRHPDNKKDFFAHLWTTIKNKKTFKGIIKNTKKDGSTYYVDSTIMPILDNNDNIIEYIGIRNDVTSLYEKDKIIYEQFIDDLTRLPNRQKLIKDINKNIFPKMAIINIDSFKDINESYGLDIGDEVLKKFSRELLLFKSINLNIYRIGADEFALLSHGNYSFKELHKTCINFLKHIHHSKFIIDNNVFNLSCSIGISDHNKKLFTHSEMALSYAKKNDVELFIFDKEIDDFKNLKKNIELTQEIKYAINNDNILLYGQKIINNITQEVKYETLMRMKQKDGRILSPFDFLKQAKKAKLYPMMTKIMIDKACEYFKDKTSKFSINLTLQDITNKDTIEFLIRTLKQTNTSNRVLIEIVESEGIENFEEVSRFIDKVKKIGCEVAIDDFGTGYSNFEYITRLNIDILKIDGSLIKNIHKNQKLLITVRSIVSFAKALNIEVVAEFVHCQEVYQIIKEIGITYSQGYLFHKPEALN